MTLNPKITVNRRHQRSKLLCAIIMKIVEKHFQPWDDRSPTDFYDDLFNFVHNSGMEIITDDMRKEAGLEQRNENGCTPLELMLIEYFFISRMLKPIIVHLPPPMKMEPIDQNSVWLPRKAPDKGYPSEMIDAGIKYLDERCVNKKFELPAMFNWHDFMSTMLSAIKE